MSYRVSFPLVSNIDDRRWVSLRGFAASEWFVAGENKIEFQCDICKPDLHILTAVRFMPGSCGRVLSSVGSIYLLPSNSSEKKNNQKSMQSITPASSHRRSDEDKSALAFAHVLSHGCGQRSASSGVLFNPHSRTEDGNTAVKQLEICRGSIEL